jgi:hypothetical protein
MLWQTYFSDTWHKCDGLSLQLCSCLLDGPKYAFGALLEGSYYCKVIVPYAKLHSSHDPISIPSMQGCVMWIASRTKYSVWRRCLWSGTADCLNCDGFVSGLLLHCSSTWVLTLIWYQHDPRRFGTMPIPFINDANVNCIVMKQSVHCLWHYLILTGWLLHCRRDVLLLIWYQYDLQFCLLVVGMIEMHMKCVWCWLNGSRLDSIL